MATGNQKKKKAKAKKLQKVKKVKNKVLSPQEETAKKIVREVEAHESRRDKKSIEDAIKDGQRLIYAEKILTRNGKTKRCNLGKFLRKNSVLKPRTIQRYIQLAKNVDLKKYPNLAYVGQANLLRLIQLGKGKTPARVLADNGVNIEFDGEDVKARKKFRSKTADLIEQLTAEQRKSKEEEKPSSKEPGEGLAKMLRKMDQLLKQPKEREGLKKRLKEDEDLQAINKSVRIQLRELPPELKKQTGKPSTTKKGGNKKVAAQGKTDSKKTSIKRTGKSKKASGRK
jgi:hypothetical protein